MQHAHRPRRRLMGAGLFAANFAVAISSACSAPTEASGPDEHWTLVAVDGIPLPALIGPGAEIVGGSLELSRDGSYTKQTRAIIEGVTFEDLHTGHWTARVGQIALRPSDGGDPVVARWHDGSIEIPGVRTIRYLPASAAPPVQRNGPAASPSAPGSSPGYKPPKFDRLSGNAPPDSARLAKACAAIQVTAPRGLLDTIDHGRGKWP